MEISQKADKSCVIMFVKFPEKGKAKSRLAASLGEETALSLYKCFVNDLMDTLGKTPYPLLICFHPPDKEQGMKAWLGKGQRFMPQTGEDLGERMKNAFITAFSQGFSAALLIGSDTPHLTSGIFHEAFESLASHDAVIGPAPDGGYYLVGFNMDTFAPHIFEGIEWSTPEVHAKTIDILKTRGSRVHILPEWRDVDTLDDLKALFSENRDTAFAASATMKYLLQKELA